MGRGTHCVLAWLTPGKETSNPGRRIDGAQNTRNWAVLILIGTQPMSAHSGGSVRRWLAVARSHSVVGAKCPPSVAGGHFASDRSRSRKQQTAADGHTSQRQIRALSWLDSHA